MKLTFASRIFAGYFVVVGIAAWFLVNTLVEEIKPVVRQAVEFTLVDTANILAEILADQVSSRKINQPLIDAVIRAKSRRLNAEIWSFSKKEIDLNFYVTDVHGIVVYDSENIRVGQDYSQWRDVFLTLNGRYGARSTWSDSDDPFSSIMHVAAPIIQGDEIIGVVSVFTPNISLQPFLDTSRRSALKKGLLLLIVALIVGAFISYWLSYSVTQLVKYANRVKAGERVRLPRLGGRELQHLADSLESMRTELEGKDYVENYVQQLTHELKSPVAAIRGAAELITKDTPPEVQNKFLSNIRLQAIRIQSTIDKMLYLTVLENTSQLDKKLMFDVVEICRNAADTKKARAEAKQVTLELFPPSEHCQVKGDPVLIQLALENLLENSIDFALFGSCVEIKIMEENQKYIIVVSNAGSHIPDYAKDRIYERFYSLPRPDGEPKSTGLGLSFVKEVATLHGGEVNLRNAASGVQADFSLPKSP